MALRAALDAAAQARFEARAAQLGHDAHGLAVGEAVATFVRVASLAEARRLSLAGLEERARRQAVFFGPTIAVRRRIGQGVHDRCEAHIFADGEVGDKDRLRLAAQFPFPTRFLSTAEWRVAPGDVWDVSVRGEHWGLDDRDDILSVVNVGQLVLCEGAGVVVRGNLLVLSCQRLVCEAGGWIGVLATPFSVDRRSGPLEGQPGVPGRAARHGSAGRSLTTVPTILGPSVPELPPEGWLDGAAGEDGEDGTAGGHGRTGGATKLAEITLFDLVGSVTVVAEAGHGGRGGSGAAGGRGGDGGPGAAGARAVEGALAGGRGGDGGSGGNGGDGGRGGHGGIASNVFVCVPAHLEGRVRVVTGPGRGAAGGGGGREGSGGVGGERGGGPQPGAVGRPGRDGRPGRAGLDGRDRPAPPVFVNGRPPLPQGDEEAEHGST